MAANPSPNFSFVDDATFGPGIAEIEVETVLEQSKPKRKRSSTVSSEGESSSKKKRKRKVLNKEQKRMILFCLCDAESKQVSSFVEAKVNSEKHISCPEEKIFWESIQSCAFFMDLLNFFGEAFVQIYKSCDQGKEKFMKFQLEWHKMCSIFLLPSSTAIEELGWSPSRLQLKTDMEKIRQIWIGFCEGKDVSEWNRNAVMITISAAAYDFYLRLLTKCQQEISDGESENPIEECVKKKILFTTDFVEQRCQACCIVVTKKELIVLSLIKKIAFNEKLLFLGPSSVMTKVISQNIFHFYVNWIL